MGLSGYLFFACGQLGLMALARFFFQWVLRFAGAEQGGTEPLFAAASVGLLFFGFRAFDAVTDPLAGILSDQWTRRGRQRRSLLWLSFALPALGLVLVFAPAPEMSQSLRWILLALGMFVFFVGYTAYAIPYWSLVDDYSGGDEQRRARLSNILGASLLVATGLGFVLSPMLVERMGYRDAAIVFAIPAAVLMVLPYFAVSPATSKPASGAAEAAVAGAAARPAAVPPPPDAVATDGVWAGIRAGLRHRRFRAVIVLFAGGQMSFTVMTAAAPFIAVDLLRGTTGDVALLLGPFLVLAVPSFAFVPRLARRFGWERVTTIATVGLGIAYAGTGLLGAGDDPLRTGMIVFACGGPMAAVLLGLEAEAITACAAEHQDKLTSIYFGIYNLVVKGCNGLALFLTGLLAAAAEGGDVLAVRGMGWLAGGLLVVGVVGYFMLRPKKA